MGTRRVFAASVVVTLAGCSGAAKETRPDPAFVRRWNVIRHIDACEALDTLDDCPKGASCNPPPPRAIACPEGAKEDGMMIVGERLDHTCAIVPPGCSALACATVNVECPK